MNSLSILPLELYSEVSCYPENFHLLTQEEKKIVLLSLKCLVKEKKKCKGLTDRKFNQIKQKLESKREDLDRGNLDSLPLDSIKNIFASFLKYVAVSIGFLVSDQMILDELAKVKSRVNEHKKLVTSLEASTKSKKEQLVELKELSRFQREDALPLYQDIADFYQNLPLKFDEAEPMLDDKITEIQGKISNAKAEGKEAAYLHILEKEILESLMKMRKYQDKNRDQVILDQKKKVEKTKQKSFSSEEIQHSLQANFAKEVRLTINAWDNAKSECEHQKYTTEAIQETEEKIISNLAQLSDLTRCASFS